MKSSMFPGPKMPAGTMTFTNMKQSSAAMAKPLVTADD